MSTLALAFDNFNLSHTYNVDGLIINPANPKELIYLEYSHQTRVYVDEELIDKGKDEYNSGKIEEAKNKFEMAIKLWKPNLIIINVPSLVKYVKNISDSYIKEKKLEN